LKKSEFLLVDTPGQLELFAFRELGNKIISMICEDVSSDVSVFLIDETQIRKPSDVVMGILLALAIRFHLNINVVSVLNKLDVAGPQVIKMFEEFFSNTSNFSKFVAQDSGVLGEMSSQLVNVLRAFVPPTRVVAISALKNRGMEDLFSIIHDAICTCGDMT